MEVVQKRGIEPPRQPNKTPFWEELADQLRRKRFDRALVLEKLSVPAVIAGFILTKLGVLAPDCDIDVRGTSQASDELRAESIALYNPNTVNPMMLTDLISDPPMIQSGAFETPLSQNDLGKLRLLALDIQFYLRKPQAQDGWWQTRENFQGSKPFNEALHNILGPTLSAYRRNSRVAYLQCQKALERLYARPDFGHFSLDPFEVKTHFIKSKIGEADIIRSGILTFDLWKALFLADSRCSIVVGGPPHSGKSTFANSLYKRMLQLRQVCVEKGVLGEDELKIGLCELDLAARTQEAINSGDSSKKTKRPWDEQLLQEAEAGFARAQEEFNIVIADLPGGNPDEDDIAFRLSTGADFSIRIDNSVNLYGSDKWKKFVYGAHLPYPLAYAHSRFNEPGRLSGTRAYESVSRGDRRDFLRGRIVDFNLVAKPEDSFIQLAAAALMFDYLPERTYQQLHYDHEVMTSFFRGKSG